MVVVYSCNPTKLGKEDVLGSGGSEIGFPLRVRLGSTFDLDALEEGQVEVKMGKNRIKSHTGWESWVRILGVGGQFQLVYLRNGMSDLEPFQDIGMRLTEGMKRDTWSK